MSKVIRTMLSLAVALVLLGTLTMAQAGANTDKKNTDKNKNDKQHHSRLAKTAFWRHHQKSTKNAKQVPAPLASKPAPAKTAQLKPVSAKASVGKKDRKPEQHSSNTAKPSPKKAPAASTANPQPKGQDGQTASLKQ